MNTKYKELKQMLGERLKVNEILAPYTTFKIGGPADFFYEARTVEELVKTIVTARNLAIQVFILGGGSNLLIGDRGIRGLVIKNNTARIAMRGARGIVRRNRQEGLVYVEADSGVLMNKLIRRTIEEGLSGLEMHLGLPGTVGGAIFMNSKWTKPPASVGDAVYQASILRPDSEVARVPQDYFQFGYDHCLIQRTQDIVLSVIFALRQAAAKLLWSIAERSIAYRRESQPQGQFSAGCIFTNLTKAQAMAHGTPNQTTSVGFLIDHTGLKGLSVGDAEISQIHANFIVNKAHAQARDVVQLIEIVRTRVKERFGVTLEEEIIRKGEF